MLSEKDPNHTGRERPLTSEDDDAVLGGDAAEWMTATQNKRPKVEQSQVGNQEPTIIYTKGVVLHPLESRSQAYEYLPPPSS